MALKHLSVAEMITISDTWVTQESLERNILASAPETEALLRHVDRSHRDLLKTQTHSDTALIALGKKATKLDSRHDDLTRGVHGFLNACCYFTEDEALRNRMLEARDTLFPAGLAIVKAGYREEAGSTMLMEERITPQLRELLTDLKIPSGTLLDAVEALISTGRTLGEMEDKRAEMQANNSLPKQADILAARNRWIRMTHALVAALELAEIDQTKKDTLLAPLEKATNVADRRYQRRPKDEPETTTSSNGNQPSDTGGQPDDTGEQQPSEISEQPSDTDEQPPT